MGTSQVLELTLNHGGLCSKQTYRNPEEASMPFGQMHLCLHSLLTASLSASAPFICKEEEGITVVNGSYGFNWSNIKGWSGPTSKCHTHALVCCIDHSQKALQYVEVTLVPSWSPQIGHLLLGCSWVMVLGLYSPRAPRFHL